MHSTTKTFDTLRDICHHLPQWHKTQRSVVESINGYDVLSMIGDHSTPQYAIYDVFTAMEGGREMWLFYTIFDDYTWNVRGIVSNRESEIIRVFCSMTVDEHGDTPIIYPGVCATTEQVADMVHTLNSKNVYCMRDDDGSIIIAKGIDGQCCGIDIYQDDTPVVFDSHGINIFFKSENGIGPYHDDILNE